MLSSRSFSECYTTQEDWCLTLLRVIGPLICDIKLMPTICLLLKYFATVLTKTQQIIAFPCHRPNDGLFWHLLALEMILNTWDNIVVDARLALWLTMCYHLVNKYTTYTLLLLTGSPDRYMNVMQTKSCGTDMKLFICIFWILWTISEVLDFRHKKYAISAKIDGIFLFVCSVQVPGVGRKSCQCKLGNSYLLAGIRL